MDSKTPARDDFSVRRSQNPEKTAGMLNKKLEGVEGEPQTM